MRRALLAFLCSACVSEPGTSEHAVYGGYLDYGDPAVVAVWASTTEMLCTGSVIAPRVVLTAGHCIDNIPDLVLFGTGPTGFSGLRVIEAEANPSYEPSTLYHDYGLLLLEKEAPVEPLPIFRGSITDSMLGKPLRLVGFGDTGSGSGVKHEVSVPLEAYDLRLLQFGDFSVGLGPGDSGGPQLMTIDGEEVVVGVARSMVPGDSLGSRVDRVAESWIDPWIQDRQPWQGAFGQFCVADSECWSGVCLEDDLYCSQACTTNYDCPAGIPCRDVLGQTVCAYAEPSPEPDQVACTANGRAGVCLDVTDCTGEHMSVPGYCPGPVNIQCCVPTAAPPSTESPISTTDLPMPGAASDEDLRGGCAIHGGAAGSASLPLFLGVLAVGVRLLRRSREEGRSRL